MADNDWIIEALRLTAGEPSSEVHWRNVEGRIELWFDCSDVFHWGSADAEQITEDLLPLLAQTRADLRAVGDVMGGDLADLFCARVRRMRPQGAWYKHVAKDRRALFDACGPHRPAEFDNPVATPAA